MREGKFRDARMRIVQSEAFLVDEKGYVYHATSGELGHIEDCAKFAELIWTLSELSDSPPND